jgi:hypothetical protein
MASSRCTSRAIWVSVCVTISTGESTFLQQLALAFGIATPTRAEQVRINLTRSNKESNGK